MHSVINDTILPIYYATTLFSRPEILYNYHVAVLKRTNGRADKGMPSTMATAIVLAAIESIRTVEVISEDVGFMIGMIDNLLQLMTHSFLDDLIAESQHGLGSVDSSWRDVRVRVNTLRLTLVAGLENGISRTPSSKQIAIDEQHKRLPDIIIDKDKLATYTQKSLKKMIMETEEKLRFVLQVH